MEVEDSRGRITARGLHMSRDRCREGPSAVGRRHLRPRLLGSSSARAQPAYTGPSVRGLKGPVGPLPLLGVQPLTLQFGRIHVNNLRQLTTRILNVGTQAAQLKSITGGDKGFSAPAGPPPPVVTIQFGGEVDYKFGF